MKREEGSLAIMISTVVRRRLETEKIGVLLHSEIAGAKVCNGARGGFPSPLALNTFHSSNFGG